MDRATGSWTRRRTPACPSRTCKLLVPVPRPNKLFLLAGNYADHIQEGGGVAAERAETFPYVFMKPPTTTLTNPGHPIVIPAVSPDRIDWELELAVIIGRRCKGVPESRGAAECGRLHGRQRYLESRVPPQSGTRQREKDDFFDWLHGKWHDSFCPCGPCVTSADAIPDPQDLTLQLR